MSTNKIIILVIFVCAALSSSLAIFHLKHKETRTMISTNEMTLFPIAREIKPFELVSVDEKKFTQKDFLNHWTLLFFGFTHCLSVCPTTFEMMNRAYASLHPAYPNLQIVLVSLDPERDTPQVLASYVHSFNPDFKAATGKIQELRKLQSQLNIYSARDATSDANYQIQHTSSIMLINPQGKWAGLFSYGLQPEQFVRSFEESVRQLS